MDLLRRALGEQKLNYLGFSYGTFLGSTYASLFPRNYRAMVLDGPVDADGYINKPMGGLREQSAGFERALGRFFQACAVDQAACLGFGGNDPWDAFDPLVDQANAKPLPAAGYPPIRGRSTATTSWPRRLPRCTPSSSGRCWPRRSPRRRPATAR